VFRHNFVNNAGLGISSGSFTKFDDDDYRESSGQKFMNILNWNGDDEEDDD